MPAGSPAPQHELELVLAGVAHDLGNLLAVVSNYATLATRQIDDPTALEWLGRSKLAADRGSLLVREVAELAGCTKAVPEPMSVNAAVRAAVAQLSGLPSGCSVDLDLAADPLEACGDPTAVDLVLMHLIRNAVEAMPDGGRVVITTRSIGSDGTVELRVADEGVGMAPSVADRAFDALFSTKPKGEGTGLGLALVRRSVEHLGGDVRLESTEGEGTTVVVTLPGPAPDG